MSHFKRTNWFLVCSIAGVLVVVAALPVIGVGLFLSNWHPSDVHNLPPLLQNVTASSGYLSACAPPPQDPPDEKPGISPELDARIRAMFPAGTSEKQIAGSLHQQGFEEIARPCDADPTIHASYFREQGDNLLTRATATVFWKVDLAQNVIWTKSFAWNEGM